jgi:agmatinase
MSFSPDDVGLANGHLFGIPVAPTEARIVVIPVPWAATVSYHSGAEDGPEAILEASPQLDFYHPQAPEAWKLGFALLEVPADIRELSDATRPAVERLIALLEGREAGTADTITELRTAINTASGIVNQWVHSTAQHWLAQGKLVAVLGGEHSCPLGLLQALGERHPEGFGILQVDAHADLRNAYMGLQYSHASIMFNALQVPHVRHLVQVGIRDLSATEAHLAQADGRVHLHHAQVLAQRRFVGESWHNIVESVLATLPNAVYVSFDIDGQEPHLCPHTGTPVPGGLPFAEAVYLLNRLASSGRRIIGFDLCEVVPPLPNEGDWDANVGARVLWELCVQTSRSQGWC